MRGMIMGEKSKIVLVPVFRGTFGITNKGLMRKRYTIIKQMKIL